MFYVLKIKLEQNLKAKQKKQMMTEILAIKKTNKQKTKQPNKKPQHKIHPDMTVKEILFEKNFLYSLWMDVLRIKY